MDQILHAHLAPFKPENRIQDLDCGIVFDMTGGFSPISIKDQIIRASLIVERAAERGLITEANGNGKSSRPLLVVGGGISGVAACYHASKKNIQSILIEKESRPLAKYAIYGNRLVIPNQYDWPFTQWERENFPFSDSEEIYINLKEFEMGGNIGRFTRYWGEVAESRLNTLYDESELTGIEIEKPLEGKFAVASVKLKSTRLLTGIGMILVCIGFGREKTFVEKHTNAIPPKQKIYMGVPFWNLNALTISKIRTENAHKNVLICGGGDGSLQDFLLFVTGENSVKDIYHKLPVEIREYEKHILEAEIQAQKSELWIGNRNDDQNTKECLNQRSHGVYHQLHINYQSVVDRLISETVLWDQVKNSLIDMVDPFFEVFKNRVTLAYPCDHFSKCYAFNRFLTLLIAAYIQEKESWGDPLLPQTAITDVSPVFPHSCKTSIFNKPETGEDDYRDKINAAADCFNENHRIKYRRMNCRGFTSQETNLTSDPFGPVIIRFGIDLPSLNLAQLDPPYYTAQMLPYIIPSKS